jgi:hypothetical protein
MILDGIVALLLATTILYCWRMSKKIASLHSSRRELQKFLDDFNQSIERANASIALLKALSVETDTSLRGHIDKARFLSNDLAFLTHKANNIANKLEDYIAGSRVVDPNPMGLKSAGRTMMQQGRVPDFGEQENEGFPIPHAWKFPEKQATHGRSGGKQEMPPSKRQALDAALAQIASRRKPSTKPEQPVAAAPAPRRPQGNIAAARESVDSLRSSLEIKT